ncbi:hypothetical protein SAMN05421752_105114 [Natronorubrum thiooxidans]|uniref:Uncharacterized protein n=1 Tax=Natronorubrum thiooxidans TaxID=308853 RepID=A0A1N7EWA4_9EURY|nr:hypothetical protein SAMN05421752_105114 [Natronorubrum thiooxidans]
MKSARLSDAGHRSAETSFSFENMFDGTFM